LGPTSPTQIPKRYSPAERNPVRGKRFPNFPSVEVFDNDDLIFSKKSFFNQSPVKDLSRFTPDETYSDAAFNLYRNDPKPKESHRFIYIAHQLDQK
jgi:hypothetical protein